MLKQSDSTATSLALESRPTNIDIWDENCLDELGQDTRKVEEELVIDDDQQRAEELEDNPILDNLELKFYNKEKKEKLKTKYASFGPLKFSKLIQDHRICFCCDPRDRKDKSVDELTTYKDPELNTVKSAHISFGQHQPDNKDKLFINGIGRDIRIVQDQVQIREGQFLIGKLDGFGREIHIDMAKGTVISAYVGHWKMGDRHGFGRYLDKSGINADGLFERSVYSFMDIDEQPKERATITKYDPGQDKIAKWVNLDKYCQKFPETKQKINQLF